MQHKLSHYRDGTSQIEFCQLCGKEGSELILQCTGFLVDKDELQRLDNLALSDCHSFGK